MKHYQYSLKYIIVHDSKNGDNLDRYFLLKLSILTIERKKNWKH